MHTPDRKQPADFFAGQFAGGDGVVERDGFGLCEHRFKFSL